MLSRSSLPWILLLALTASTGCRPRSPSPPCPPPAPPTVIDPPPARLDCRTALGLRLDAATRARLVAMPRCRRPDGSPMSSGELCLTSGDASLLGAVAARLLLADDRVRACLDGAAP
jgi:hypothetical protein